jgi:hypothetical protein
MTPPGGSGWHDQVDPCGRPICATRTMESSTSFWSTKHKDGQLVNDDVVLWQRLAPRINHIPVIRFKVRALHSDSENVCRLSSSHNTAHAVRGRLCVRHHRDRRWGSCKRRNSTFFGCSYKPDVLGLALYRMLRMSE